MPTYQYRCTECGRELEVVQKFSDPSLTECPNCSGQLRKIFNAVGVVFKGSGFYRTDSRDAGKKHTADHGKPKTSAESSGSSSEGSSKDSGSSSNGSGGSSKNGSSSNGSGSTSKGKQPATSGAGKAAASS